MKNYCVVYLIWGIHLRYRCRTTSASKAKKLCIEYMRCKKEDIVNVYVEEY